MSRSSNKTAVREPARIFSNAVIHTLDPARPGASVLAARGRNIVYTGTSEQEAARLLPDARVLDLGGAAVIPGIIEGHMHFLTEGIQLSEMNIFRKPKAEILRLVAVEAAQRAPGAWITGRGWNNELWQDTRWPEKEELDKAAPHNPVLLTRADAHSVWVNSETLRAAGIDADTPNPAGGEIIRRANGEASGILVDTAIFKARGAAPAPTPEQALEAYRKAERELFRYGITSLADAWQSAANHRLLKKAFASGVLQIRVHGMLASRDEPDAAYFRNKAAPVRGLFGERLFLDAFKIVLDGSLGSRSAWLLHDYADRPGHRGNGRYTDGEVYELVRLAREKGFQACIHAIGDAAVRQAVRAVARVLSERPLPDHRYRIEHFQIVDPTDLREALALGIIPTMQTIHAVSDRRMALVRLGVESLKNAYNWRNVLDAGAVFANGSDAPMEPPNPFHGMHAAVTRTDLQGNPAGGWRPEQRLSREEALKSFTLWSAYALFSEQRKGSLTPGKLADFAVLDRDIMRCPEGDLKDTRVLMTVLGGELVHDNTARPGRIAGL
jgi:predicted amidohydrolase YtcJ